VSNVWPLLGRDMLDFRRL